jgi:serine/threonine-protein kinase
MHGELAKGGMALVRIGRAVRGPAAGKLVAIKQLDGKLTTKAAFVAMFLDEGRLTMRIRHRNVVATLDVLENGGDLFQILEYVPGETLARVARCATERGRPIPTSIVSAIVCDALRGLDCAHRICRGAETLGVVHRDISPQNIIVGADGVARILDFGVAKWALRVHWTPDGAVKGKVGYVAPEQLSRCAITARADLYSLGVVLWEMLTGRKLRVGSGATEMLREALRAVPPPSSVAPSLGPAIDAVLARACALEPLDRYTTAAEMESELTAVLPPASPREVAEFMADIAADALAARARLVRAAGLDAHARAEPVSTVPPPRPDSDLHGRLLRASSERPHPDPVVDDAYLLLAGLAPASSPLPSLHPRPLDMHGPRCASSAPGRAAEEHAARRRSLRGNVLYAPARAGAELADGSAGRAPSSSRDEQGAASVDPGRDPLGGVALSHRVRRQTPAPRAEPDPEPLPRSFRQLMSGAACVLTLAAAAVLLLGFCVPRPGSSSPRSAYAWIGGYLMVIQRAPGR